MAVMGRIRVYFDADEELKLAIKQAALRAGVPATKLIEDALKREFAAEVKEARKMLQDRKKKEAGE